jgi:hypothetical protein
MNRSTRGQKPSKIVSCVALEAKLFPSARVIVGERSSDVLRTRWPFGRPADLSYAGCATGSPESSEFFSGTSRESRSIPRRHADVCPYSLELMNRPLLGVCSYRTSGISRRAQDLASGEWLSHKISWPGTYASARPVNCIPKPPYRFRPGGAVGGTACMTVSVTRLSR